MSLWIAPRPLVLASRSAARRQLLADAGIEFIMVAPDLDERGIERPLRERGAEAGEAARHLSRAKAEAVSRLHPDDLVLAADQLLDCAGRWFSKPADRAEAARQLAELRGRTHRLHSAFCLMRGGEIRAEDIGVAHLTMRPFSTTFLETYLDTAGDTILTCVGAYQWERLGAHLFATIDGDYSTILGLPLLPVLDALRREGAVAS